MITSRPVIAFNKTCTLTSRSRLESYKRLVSVSSRNFNVSSRSRLSWWSQRLGLVSVSGCERLGLKLLRFVPIPVKDLSLPIEHTPWWGHFIPVSSPPRSAGGFGMVCTQTLISQRPRGAQSKVLRGLHPACTRKIHSDISLTTPLYFTGGGQKVRNSA